MRRAQPLSLRLQTFPRQMVIDPPRDLHGVRGTDAICPQESGHGHNPQHEVQAEISL